MSRKAHYEDDRELVASCQDGDELAFEKLVRKYQQTVFNVVYHHIGSRNEVEDVAQQIFAKIYFSLPKFDNSRPFFPWLYRITLNQCYDELRRARRHKVHTFTELSSEESDTIEKLISQKEIPSAFSEDQPKMHALLQKVLGALPDRQKMAIVLHDLEGVPYDEMAKILNCTEQAVRLKVFRGRVRLRELMEKALRRRELSINRRRTR